MKKNIFLLAILSSLLLSFESSAMRMRAAKTVRKVAEATGKAAEVGVHGGNAASQLAMFMKGPESAGAKKARTQIGNSTTEERIKRIVKNSKKNSKKTQKKILNKTTTDQKNIQNLQLKSLLAKSVKHYTKN